MISPCTIYLVRHGETESNINGILQGQSDSPLTKTGINQARNLARSLTKIHFSAVYSSDLPRAAKTAEYIATNQDLTVVTSALLRERSFGRYEGKPWVYFQKKLQKLIRLNQNKISRQLFSQVDPSVESEAQMSQRLIRFLREVSLAHLNQTILVVSHGGSIRTILLHLGFLPENQFESIEIPNTAFVVIKSDGTDFEIVTTSGITQKA